MRKLYISLLMPLLMLLSQQGMVWHEIGHLSTTPASSSSQKQAPATDKLCDVCYAFAHLGAGSVPEMPKLVLASLEHVHALTEAASSLAAELPAQRSRGPPTIL